MAKAFLTPLADDGKIMVNHLIELDGTTIAFGRYDNDCYLRDKMVSRKHIQIGQ